MSESTPVQATPIPPTPSEISASILYSIKQMLGITTEQTEFDVDIIIHINSALNILHQLGIGKNWLKISDATTQWSDISEDVEKCEMIKTWMYLKVKLLFDPPLNSTVISAMERQISELEFRILENHNDK